MNILIDQPVSPFAIFLAIITFGCLVGISWISFVEVLENPRKLEKVIFFFWAVMIFYLVAEIAVIVVRLVFGV